MNIRYAARVIIGLVIISIAACLFLPVPPHTAAWLFYLAITVSVSVALTHWGATALFFSSLSGFTAAFKLAYVKLFIGISLMALASLQIPVLMAFDAIGTSVWVKDGFIVLPYLVAYTLMYSGTRSYAKLFGVSGWPVRRWLVMGLGLVVAIGVALLPHHHDTGFAEAQFDATMGFSAFQAVILLFAGVMSWLASRRAAVRYIEPLNLMAWYFYLLVAGSVVLIGVGLVVPHGLDASGYMGYCFQFIGGLLLLKAAVAFHAIIEAEQVAVAGEGLSGEDERVLIDINVYLAGLVSNISAVDMILNPMRSVTSRLTPEAHLAAADVEVLKKTYRELMEYLVQKEPVRRYGADDLRHLVERAFVKRLVNSRVWAELG